MGCTLEDPLFCISRPQMFHSNETRDGSFADLQHVKVQYRTVKCYLDGKGQCGGTIGAVIYLNKANAIRESKYTSLKTH